MPNPPLPMTIELFDIRAPKRLLAIGISPGQEVFLKQALDFPGLLVDFARNSHHAQVFINELGQNSYDFFWFDEDTMHNGDWEFLKYLQSHDQFQYTPIILQTRPDTDVIPRAIEHSIFYFLTKPYSKELMLSVLISAHRGLSNFNEINLFVTNYTQSIQLFRHAIFHAKTPEEARSLAATLSYLTPNPEKTSLGLLELIYNGIEHGNLEFGYQLKSELVRTGSFNEERQKRLKDSENSDKYVEVTITKVAHSVEFIIRDFGKGFDFDSYMDNKTYQQMNPNGRGILIAKNLSFDQLRYEDNGRAAIARISLQNH